MRGGDDQSIPRGAGRLGPRPFRRVHPMGRTGRRMHAEGPVDAGRAVALPRSERAAGKAMAACARRVAERAAGFVRGAKCEASTQKGMTMTPYELEAALHGYPPPRKAAPPPPPSKARKPETFEGFQRRQMEGKTREEFVAAVVAYC